jgi:hypothetical protein
MIVIDKIYLDWVRNLKAGDTVWVRAGGSRLMDALNLTGYEHTVAKALQVNVDAASSHAFKIIQVSNGKIRLESVPEDEWHQSGTQRAPERAGLPVSPDGKKLPDWKLRHRLLPFGESEQALIKLRRKTCEAFEALKDAASPQHGYTAIRGIAALNGADRAEFTRLLQKILDPSR